MILKYCFRSVLFLFLFVYFFIICLVASFGLYITLKIDKKNKKIKKFFKFLWLHSLMTFLSFFFKEKIFLKYNKDILKEKKNIMISNHISDFDFIFILVLSYKLNLFENVFFMMKKELNNIPIISRCFKLTKNIFLYRNKNLDLKIINNYINYYNTLKKFTLFFYPEGTYPYPKALESAQNFANVKEIKSKNRFFHPENVLLPRLTGFNYIKKNLKFNTILDVTTFQNPYVYMPSYFNSYFDILIGKKILFNQFFIVKKLDLDKINENFLIDSFYKKDVLIEKYKKTNSEIIKNLDQFKNLIKSIDEISENDVITYVYIDSKYKYILIPFSYFLLYIFIKLIILIYKIFKKSI